MKLATLWVSLSVAVLVSGCGCGTPVPTLFACEADGTCSSGNVCCDNLCVPARECHATTCDGGLQCGTACIAVAFNDSNCGACGNACTAGQQCAGGKCVAQQCALTACASNQVCVDDACREKTCVGVTCEGQSTCVNGACVARNCSGQDCALGFACLENKCVDVSCINITCTAGSKCVLGRCDGLSHCSNSTTDVDETDIDCGGAACLPCTDTKMCELARDCASGVCANHQCAAGCASGSTCGSNPGSPCKTGKRECSTTPATCIDDGNALDGTPCATGFVCGSGTCRQCVENGACATNATACHVGRLSCSDPITCVDTATLRAPGTSCGTNRTCNAAGDCVACTPGASCSTNPLAPCKAGAISCTTGGPVCLDGANAGNGLNCGTDQVCIDGACSSCAPGTACRANPTNPCKVGSVFCGSPIGCNDGANAIQGTACDAGVCNGGGQCVTCVMGAACANNPGSCKVGVTDCRTGSAQCVDSSNAPAGTACGSGLVCDGTGVCGACTAGQPCSTNPSQCRFGTTSCATGSQVCIDGAPKNPSVSCNGTMNCDGNGFCGQCVPNVSCTGNASPCKAGVTMCVGSTSTTCVDSTTSLPPGTNCGAGQVCNASGSCVTCSAGQVCSGNPTVCRAGITTCASGTSTCVDGTISIPGTSCGVNRVCDSTGSCGACTSGNACATNPGLCKTGVTSCVTGTTACLDSGNKNAGLACGSNLVCDGAGTCTACSGGASCTTNPGSACRVGVISCSTGAAVCVDGAPKAGGTSCGTNMVCNGSGACASCVAGQSCSGNPGVCKIGVSTCATGAMACADGANKPAGSTCGTNMVCSASGSCGACTAGLSCSTNPSAACRDGVTSCASGASTCVDGSPKTMGTPCGSGQTCDGAGFCGTCTAGQSCSSNPNAACFSGVTSCTGGATSCVNGTIKPAGSTCGLNMVCSPAGACTLCAESLACTNNPGICRTGVTDCGTGTLQCLDDGNKPAGTNCGTNQVCNGGGSCVTCTANATCNTNPNPCVAGITSCTAGGQQCNDTSTPVAGGAACGTNRVCNGSGVCIACTTGSACSGNPGICHSGITSCATGAPVCSDGPISPPGTTCGLDAVCNSLGVCASCVSGDPCLGNPGGVCWVGETSCATGVSTCVDKRKKPIGTGCGHGFVCDNAGVCSGMSCPMGCIDAAGDCQPGTTLAACGSMGSICGTCDPGCGSCIGDPRRCDLTSMCQ